MTISRRKFLYGAAAAPVAALVKPKIAKGAVTRVDPPTYAGGVTFADMQLDEHLAGCLRPITVNQTTAHIKDIEFRKVEV